MVDAQGFQKNHSEVMSREPPYGETTILFTYPINERL